MAVPAYLASIDDLAVLVEVTDVSDAKLELALRRASDAFAGAVGRPVVLVTDDVLVLAGGGGSSLFLPAAPVTAVTVSIGGVPVTDFTPNSRDLAAGILRLDCWPDDDVTVTYTHGYDPIPGDIQDAVLERAETQYQILTGVAQMSLGSQSVTLGTQATVGTTKKWADAVARYKL